MDSTTYSTPRTMCPNSMDIQKISIGKLNVDGVRLYKCSDQALALRSIYSYRMQIQFVNKSMRKRLFFSSFSASFVSRSVDGMGRWVWVWVYVGDVDDVEQNFFCIHSKDLYRDSFFPSFSLLRLPHRWLWHRRQVQMPIVLSLKYSSSMFSQISLCCIRWWWCWSLENDWASRTSKSIINR